MGLSDVWNAVKQLASRPRYTVIFASLAAALMAIYYWLFISSAVGFLLLGKYYTAYSITMAVALSVMVSMAISVNLMAYGTLSKGKLGVSSIVIGALPSACCTSLVPALLASLGGFSFAASMTGKIQGALGELAPVLDLAAVVLAVISLHRASTYISRGHCRVGGR